MESPDVAWSRQVIYDPAYDYRVKLNVIKKFH